MVGGTSQTVGEMGHSGLNGPHSGQIGPQWTEWATSWTERATLGGTDHVLTGVYLTLMLRINHKKLRALLLTSFPVELFAVNFD